MVPLGTPARDFRLPNIDGKTVSLMGEEAAKAGYKFPYLFDFTQAIAHAYDAACTPDFFLYDRARRFVYRGQFDEARPANGKPVTGSDLRAPITEVLAGKLPNPKQIPSLGCNIKWKGSSG